MHIAPLPFGAFLFHLSLTDHTPAPAGIFTDLLTNLC
jgi:hypothetical protein